MKILVFSSLAGDTGSAVRAQLIAKALKEAGANSNYCPAIRKTLPFRLDFFLSAPWYLCKTIVSCPDVVIIVKSYPNIIPVILFQKLIGKKIVIDTDDLSFAFSSGFKSILSKIMQEFILPLADLHTCHNRFLQKYLETKLKISIKKIYLLKQGIDTLKFKPFKKNERGNSNNLVFVGHFDIACDLEYILKELPKIMETFKDLKLTIVGDGPRKEEYRNLCSNLGISDRIIWTGLVTNQQVSKFIAQANICLLYYQASLANKFRVSLKIREYLAMGKKVVCNDFGDLKEFRKFTYQASSKISFLEKLVEVLRSGGDGRENKGVEYILKNYSWTNLGQKFYLRLFEI